MLQIISLDRAHLWTSNLCSPKSVFIVYLAVMDYTLVAIIYRHWMVLSYQTMGIAWPWLPTETTLLVTIYGSGKTTSKFISKKILSFTHPLVLFKRIQFSNMNYWCFDDVNAGKKDAWNIDREPKTLSPFLLVVVMVLMRKCLDDTLNRVLF